MSNEQYSQKENRGPLNTVGNAIGAALAVGAGAALLYKGGFNRYLSDSTIGRVEKVLNGLANEVSSIDKDDFNISTVKRLSKKYLTDENSIWNKAAEDFKTVINGVERDKVFLPNSSSGNIFDSLMEMSKIEKDEKGFFSDLYDTEKIKNPIFKKYENIMEEKTDEEKESVENFIDDATSNIKKYIDQRNSDGTYNVRQEELEKHFKNTTVSIEDQQNIMMDIINKLEEKNSTNSEDFNNFINDHKNIQEDTINKIRQGIIDKFSKKDNFFDSLIDRAATIQDVLNTDTNLIANGTEQAKSSVGVFDKLNAMRKLIADHPELNNLLVDPEHLRVNDEDQVYSLNTISNLKNKIVDEFADTIPGKLAKVRNFIENKDAPSFMKITGRKFDPILANIEGQGKTAISESYLRIMDKTYRINFGENSTEPLTHVEELDNTYLIMGEHGFKSKALKYMSGDADRTNIGDNEFLKLFDVFTSGVPNKMDSIKSSINKFKDPKWIKNIINSMINDGDKHSQIAAEYLENINKLSFANTEESNALKERLSFGEKHISDYFNNLKRVNDWMARNTHPLDKSATNRLAKVSGSGSNVLFKILQQNDEDMLKQFTDLYASMTGMIKSEKVPEIKKNEVFKNNDLISLMDRYFNNKSGVLNTFTTAASNSASGLNVEKLDFMKMLRKEIAKEAFIKESGSNTKQLFDLIERADLNGSSKIEAKHLAVWASMQKAANEFLSGNDFAHLKSAEDKANFLIDLEKIMSSTEKGLFKNENSEFQNSLKQMIEDKISVFDRGNITSEKDVIEGNRYNKWIHMNNPKKLLSVMNGEITLKAYMKQFTAGGGNIGEITKSTFLPYFALFRLIESGDVLGIGFSSRSTKNVVDLAKNIMLKRALPIIGAVTALSYINDTSKQLTGTSVVGAAANSVASMDLGFRRLTDITGITGFLKANRESNVMSQYLHNNEDYQSYNERLDWYRSGYTPVRKGRWWAFGSTQEFRGSKIDYYQPNYLARANSDYYDVSVYGSINNKWAHSWIPTPTHPLSTLNRLTHPYWLENYHYWDRPYPVTGKLFGEGHPWSGILNTTVGRVLKPQKMMHKKELGTSLIDVRDLIAQRNQNIMQKSQNKDLVRLDLNGALSPVSFIPYSQTTLGRQVFSLNIKNGKVHSGLYGSDNNGGLNYNATDLASYIDSPVGYGTGTNISGLGVGSSFSNTSGDGIPRLSLIGKLKATPIVSGMLRTYIEATRGVKSTIQNINSGTMAKASSEPMGMVVPDAIYKESAVNNTGVLGNKDVLSELKNMSKGKEALDDSYNSAKQLLGMYGFILDTVAPSHSSYRLAQATGISSFTRRFWGSNIGGLGGDVMEIARRFFPHENHSVNDVNPLMNTMPSWMPERFQHGDPYTLLPKGEMRLPGAGYERMYKLHPDAFGKYGAYDRMKILADIAPYSQEYKVWRDIATKTVTDNALKSNMKKIEQREQEQSKTHDFYNYKFLNNGISKKTVTIEKLLNNNTFQIYGDNKTIYKLAGINVNKNTDMSKYLQPGMEVAIGIDKDKYKRFNDDGTLNTVIYANENNLNHQLLLENKATKREDDISGAGVTAKTGKSGYVTGKVTEFIAHADIPYIHDKFMRVETPLESYQRHHIYGTEVSSWAHPIKTMLMPELNRTWSQGLGIQVLTYATWMVAKKAVSTENLEPAMKLGAQIANKLVNRGSWIGEALAGVLKPTSKLYRSIGNDLGTTLGFAGYAATRLNNPVASAINFGLLGAKYSKFFMTDALKGSGVGAAIGLGLSAVATSGFQSTKIFKPWVPKNTKKRWEIEEYYDRLRYIKYTGLYKKAARNALLFEHTNIDRLLNKMQTDDKLREKNKNRLLARRQQLSNNYAEGNSEAIAEINKALQTTYVPQRVLKAGKWTRTALAYRQAAESTMYGLKPNATWAQVLRSVPTEDRDYILEFAKEKDPKKRKKISNYFSPYEKRVLQTLWGEKVDKVKANSKFFATHQIPGMFWNGWKPSVDLDNVEIKTIKNEGLMLSDFGYYESQADTPEAKQAPAIDIHQQTSSVAIKKNLLTALNGSGLIGVNVSVQPSSAKGIQLIANIIRTEQYSLHDKVVNTLGTIF